MTVPSWDAQRWRREWKKDHGSERRPWRKTTWIALTALVAGAVAVSATQLDGASDPVVVCHATGSASQPFVRLVVDKNGYEHGHHRHHAGDYFLPAGTMSCDTAAPVGNATASPEDVVAPEPPATTEPVENMTSGDPPAANETDTPPDVAPHGNATTGENGTTPAGPDAWVRQQASQDDFEVVLSLVVGNRGDVADVALVDALPDVRRTWFLGGADSAACVLQGRDLACWFEGLGAGDTRSIELRAYTDRVPCGFSLTNTASVSAEGDARSSNDASSAGIRARAC